MQDKGPWSRLSLHLEFILKGLGRKQDSGCPADPNSLLQTWIARPPNGQRGCRNYDFRGWVTEGVPCASETVLL